MLVTVNMMLAVLALCGGVLAARGYLPHLDFWGRSASGYLTRGLTLGALSTFPRLFVWDVAWRLDPMRAFVMAMGAAPINMAANIVLLVAIWHILHARLLTIPAPHRHYYNIFTAPGYPGCIIGISRRRKK